MYYNVFVFVFVWCLKKNLNASRPSEHPPVRGKSVKTFRWDRPCMAINVSVQHNGGFFPGIIGTFNMPTSYQ